MNILMQLRKVCNHPDLFETRDYVTPSIQHFGINLIIPTIVFSIFAYDPLKTLNLNNINLLLQDNDKMSKYDYIQSIKRFPLVPFYEIYTEFINSNQF